MIQKIYSYDEEDSAFVQIDDKNLTWEDTDENDEVTQKTFWWKNDLKNKSWLLSKLNKDNEKTLEKNLRTERSSVLRRTAFKTWKTYWKKVMKSLNRRLNEVKAWEFFEGWQKWDYHVLTQFLYKILSSHLVFSEAEMKIWRNITH